MIVCDLVSLLIAAGVSRVVVPVWVVSPLEGSNRYRLEALRAVIVVPLRAASPLRVAIVLVSPLADSNRRSFKGCNSVREHQFVSASNPSRFRSGFDFVAVLGWERKGIVLEHSRSHFSIPRTLLPSVALM